MAEVHNVLMEAREDRPIVVFNTHSDYDHHWGNCYFSPCTIISHAECRENIIKNGANDLKQYREHMRGRVTLTRPNLVFTDRLRFPEEGVEFFWSPGHTTDSASCIDHVDQILIAGDNIESPIPYLRGPNFEQYGTTLRGYMDLRPRYIVTGHDNIQTDLNLLRSNLRYITAFSEWKVDITRLPEQSIATHLNNLVEILAHMDSKTVSDEIREHCRSALDTIEELELMQAYKRLIEKIRPFV